MNDKPMPAGIDAMEIHANCIDQWRTDNRKIDRLTAALQLIAAQKGMTLLGDGRYDEGANRAFEQMADIAQAALDDCA